MSTSFPAALDSYAVKVDGVDDVMAAHVNDLQDAVVALESSLFYGSQNIFINGGFDIWQRTTNDTGVTTTRKYVADRWGFVTGAGTLAGVAQSSTVRTGARSKYSCQLTGAAGVTTVNISQRIRASLASRYKRVIHFSGYIYNGSGADFTPKIYVLTPSAADNWTTSAIRNGAGAGENLQACTNAAWTLISWSADVSGYTNIDNGLEIRVEIPSGSMVAGDTNRLAEFNLVPLVQMPFVSRLPEEEMNLCQAYYAKSYGYTTVPGAVDIASPSPLYQTRNAVAGLTAGQLYPGAMRFPIRMRTTPTVTLYSPDAGTAGAIRNASGGADRTGATAALITDAGFGRIDLDNTSATAITVDQILTVHYVASVEL